MLAPWMKIAKANSVLLTPVQFEFTVKPCQVICGSLFFCFMESRIAFVALPSLNRPRADRPSTGRNFGHYMELT